MDRFTRFFTRMGYYRAAGELRRLGYYELSDNLVKEAKKLG